MPHMLHTEPAKLGISEERFQAACDLLEGWTRESSDARDGAIPPAIPGGELRPAIPGGAILLGRSGRVIEPKFYGRQGPEPDAEPIRRDAVFLLASITKPITCLGAMLLVERGLLSLTDLVTRYVPDFAAHHKEATQVLHLFTHTSGLPDMLPNNVELRKQHAPLSRFMEATAQDAVPLFQPGTNVSYQSMGTLMIAEIVQRITGLSISEFLNCEIFQPLGLSSTSLGAGELARRRIARVEIPDYLAGGDYHWNSRYWQDLGAPWGGLFSTPEDFAVLCQLMLDGGSFEGRQLIASATVARMTQNRLNDLADIPEPLRRTQPWGLGWRLNHPSMPDTFGDLLSASTFGHLGATGTMVWINPETRAFCLLFTTGLLSKNQARLVRLSNVLASAMG